MCLNNQVSELVKNFNIGIFSDAINMITVKLCTMAVLTGLYLFMLLSVTLTIFQCNSSVKHFNRKFYFLIQLS